MKQRNSDLILPIVLAFTLIGVPTALFLWWIDAATTEERARVVAACEARGGHVSEGMTDSHTFILCVEPDGSMPNVPNVETTTVVPVVVPVHR